MRHGLSITCCLLILLACLPLTAAAQDDAPAPPAKPADNEQGNAADDAGDQVRAAIEQINKQDNGVTINADERYIDVKAKVCLRVGEFLEMFACIKDTREHESVVVLEAMPSTMHLGLLLLGLEPGSPLKYDIDENPPKLIPPKGPKVKVFVVREIAGQMRETPANRWIKDNKTGDMMKDNTWLFAGSEVGTYEGKTHYHADINGSAISLVNFGDDLLTLPNKMTHENTSHDKVWAPRTKAIPPVGTAVTIRLRVEPAEDEKDKKQDAEPAAPAQDAPEA